MAPPRTNAALELPLQAALAARNSAPRVGCPDDGELAGFVDGSVARGRAAIEAHLDACAACREAIAHVAASDAGRTATAPG